MTSPDPFAAMEARRAEQSAEYGTWAAAEQIWVGNALAFDIGHPVPASQVQSDGSVVTLRHYCPPRLPGQPECDVPNNKVLVSSGPGAAVKVTQDAPAKVAPKTKES